MHFAQPREMTTSGGTMTSDGAATRLGPSYDVLIVEDDDVTREQLADILSDEGFRVLTAAHGREALAHLTATPVKVVITDLMMPVMTGRELADAMRAHPSLAQIPTLTITAIGHAHQALGGPVFLKPLNIGSLARAVRAYVAPRM